MPNTTYILAAKRTPIGSFQGALQACSATDLGAIAIQAAISSAQVAACDIDEVLMGCVLPAGLGQAPARQAAISAGIPDSVGATTVNKVCGSGMRSVMIGVDAIQAGSAQLIVAGGMESMTNTPYLLSKARAGYRLGHDKIYDHMFLDGLEDAYDKGSLMGVFADQCARDYDFTRADQDAFALESLRRATLAQTDASFATEITPVTLKNGTIVAQDEQPTRAKPEKIPLLKPAFGIDGTVTAANASSISDGAAALVLASADYVQAHNLQPMARILGHASFAKTPAHFTSAPIGAIQKLLNQLAWASTDVDLFEINEAFAVVTLAAMKAFQLDATIVNVHGGACALGHPLGASGTRIIVTLLHALQQRGLKRGIATLCIGGGEATAIAVELV